MLITPSASSTRLTGLSNHAGPFFPTAHIAYLNAFPDRDTEEGAMRETRMILWLRRNADGAYKFGTSGIFFELESDAIKFALTWG